MKNNLTKLVRVSYINLSDWVQIKRNLYHLKSDSQQLLYSNNRRFYVQEASVYMLTRNGYISDPNFLSYDYVSLVY